MLQSCFLPKLFRHLSLAFSASSTKDICSLGSETGPCKASFPRWFYDVKKGKCSQFIYGGCDGNKNNFRTEEECEKRCDSEKTAGKSSDALLKVYSFFCFILGFCVDIFN